MYVDLWCSNKALQSKVFSQVISHKPCMKNFNQRNSRGGKSCSLPWNGQMSSVIVHYCMEFLYWTIKHIFHCKQLSPKSLLLSAQSIVKHHRTCRSMLCWFLLHLIEHAGLFPTQFHSLLNWLDLTPSTERPRQFLLKQDPWLRGEVWTGKRWGISQE